MNDYRSYTCPACHGKGCQLCHGKGTVMATKSQLEEAKAFLRQIPPEKKQQILNRQNPNPETVQTPKTIQPDYTEANQPKNKFALIITLIILSLIAGGIIFSLIYFKSLRPFIFTFISLVIILISLWLWNSKLIAGRPPEDFISKMMLDKPSIDNKTSP